MDVQSHTMDDALYMQRCIDMAKLGLGAVAPNPMVGSVLVHEGRIIGEGYHQQYGEAHAEVRCIGSVRDEDKCLIYKSTLYVSLEPCAHFGKTPPCSSLIIENKIPKVVIGCYDPFKQVNGKGIEQLQQAGIVVVTGILENECKQLNKRFFTFHIQQRPYIILKWAQTNNGFIAHKGNERLYISNEYTNRLVHKWRSEEAAILVGTNTVMKDDPALNNRLWKGKCSVRLVLDMDLRLPPSLQVFDRKQSTIVFTSTTQSNDNNLVYYQIEKGKNIPQQILHACYQLNIQSVLIEGGATLLQSFIDIGLWDEARVITNQNIHIDAGVQSPLLSGGTLQHSTTIFTDTIHYYTH